ncbi:MAG: 4-hydroxy-tetrahydrodipicolinate synthase [Gammaproteobacteria bacterium RIFCSPHIGHO2_12_FULL_43_28]|nr:MAG: 4-hydroxy-tetrahydrodipicolinate synthase [Gammaproteobacteria bacterium RIFCSPHIGHO2_12_FULL_43_28]
MFKGSMVALVTPMHEEGSIDKKAFADLIEWHIASKTEAIVIAGTTGESATLLPDEQYELISLAVKQIAGRTPVIAGTGSNSTQTTALLTENAKRAGADACLIVTPYYNKPTQHGLYQHYKYVAEKTDHPIILYNVPSRTGCDLLPETVLRLSTVKNIIAIKEATGKLERANDIMARCDKRFHVYSGDDATALELMQHGAKGVISVTANVAPEKMHAMCTAALTGNNTLASKLNNELMLLHQRLFLESNPIPTKWALYSMGKIKNALRMPLLPLDNQYHEAVKEALNHAGVK